jgi:hypothetical protein
MSAASALRCRTQGFVELPPQAEPFPEGFIAQLYRW